MDVTKWLQAGVEGLIIFLKYGAHLKIGGKVPVKWKLYSVVGKGSLLSCKITVTQLFQIR